MLSPDRPESAVPAITHIAMMVAIILTSQFAVIATAIENEASALTERPSTVEIAMPTYERLKQKVG
jgi:hypothetical protein